MTHPTRAFSGSIINRFTGSKILARVGQISVAFPTGSPIKIGEQAFTFTDVEAGTKYTHMFDKRASEERYKIEYTFMSVTQETYIKELNLFTNQ